MNEVVNHIVLAMAVLALVFLAAKMVFHAYFAAKAQYVNHMIEKAKELVNNHGKK